MRYFLTILFFVLALKVHAQSGDFRPITDNPTEIKLYEAEALWRKGDSVYFTNLRYNHIPEKQAKLSAEYFKKALKKNPNHSPSMNGLGLTCFSTQKYEEAKLYFSKAIEVDSHSMAYNNRGMVYSTLKQYPLALADYNESIKRDSLNSLTYYNLGCTYDALGKYESAILYYNKALAIHPEYLAALNNRAGDRLLLGHYKEALADLNGSIAKDSFNKSSFNSRGLVQYYLGNYEAALMDFQKALTCPAYDNSYVDVFTYNNMGNCYFALSQNNKACEWWKKAIENGYRYEPQWKEIYKIDDPNVLLLKHCR